MVLPIGQVCKGDSKAVQVADTSLSLIAGVRLNNGVGCLVE